MDKKGNVVAIGIFVVIFLGLIPIVVDLVGSTRYPDCVDISYPDYNAGVDACVNNSNIACMNSTLYVYNSTYDVCYNGTYIEINTSRAINTTDNIARGFSGLSAVEYSLIGLVTLFMVVGLVYVVLKKTGLVGGKE